MIDFLLDHPALALGLLWLSIIVGFLGLLCFGIVGFEIRERRRIEARKAAELRRRPTPPRSVPNPSRPRRP